VSERTHDFPVRYEKSSFQPTSAGNLLFTQFTLQTANFADSSFHPIIFNVFNTPIFTISYALCCSTL